MTKRKKNLLNKFVSLIISTLATIILLGIIVNFLAGLRENSTVSMIRSGSPINPPDQGIRVGARQLDFIEGIKQDILLSDEQIDEINSIGRGSAGASERRRDALHDLYMQRELTWARLTTPLDFTDFVGVIDSIDSSTVAGGPNSGAGKITVKVSLFGSGIILEDHMIFYEGSDPIETSNNLAWEIMNAHGNKINWFDLNNGDVVMLNGAFVRYSDETQWAHCCVSSVDWPIFRIDFRSMQRLLP